MLEQVRGVLAIHFIGGPLSYCELNNALREHMTSRAQKVLEDASDGVIRWYNK